MTVGTLCYLQMLSQTKTRYTVGQLVQVWSNLGTPFFRQIWGPSCVLDRCLQPEPTLRGNFFCCESHQIYKFNFVDFSIKKKQAICQPWMKKMKIATQSMGSKFRSLSKLLIVVKPAKRGWSRKIQWVGWTATTYRTGYEMLLINKKQLFFWPHKALKAETCPTELAEMHDEVSDMTDKFRTSGRKDRSNSIRR